MSVISCDNSRITFTGNSRLLATAKTYNGLSARISGSSSIKSTNGIFRGCSSSLRSTFEMQVQENMDFGPKGELSELAVGEISASTSANLSVYQRVLSAGSFKTGKVDKFAGYKPHFRAYEKLYPIQDISFKSKLSNQNITVYKIENNVIRSSNIYTSIDDGVFTGDYVDNGKIGSNVSDDNSSIAFTYSVLSSGDIQYKFRVTNPLSVAKLSYLAIRSSAPFDRYLTKKPQQYKFYDIKLEDPDGNLIIQYEDIPVRGDSNFTTYISKPLINNLLLPTWDSNYPLMGGNGPYTLTLNITFDCNSYPFTGRFNDAYEQTCIINKDQLNPNPFLSLDISAIEIGNNGGVGIQTDNFINLFSQVTDQPNRISRTLSPTQILPNSFNDGIYPESNSIWTTTINDSTYDNTTSLGADKLLSRVTTNFLSSYITLSSTNTHPDSGRLILKFNTIPKYEKYAKNVGGSFAFGGSNAFNDSTLVNYKDNDEFFNIDKLELKIVARKAVGSPDYPIDVVGYSDDKLLNVTPAINGFVQNSNINNFNSNTVPDVSGFYSKNVGMSDSAFSDQSSYYLQDLTNKGDHYILSSPIVNSTSFKEYTIPLTIYEDNTRLGNTKYSSSSFFENLFLDISPIPNGASISKIELIVYYRPSNALMLFAFGSPSTKKAGFSNLTLFPTSSGTINTVDRLSGILTGFTSPDYLKTNYSRRWRGHTGDILNSNSFDYSEFDFSFDHKQANTPFSCYVDFTKTNLNYVYDHKNTAFAQSINNLNVLSNFGWRYSSDQLIDGVTTPYKSISWNNNIHDTFDRALKVNENIELKSAVLNTNNSFALLIKYTPDNADLLDIDNYVIFSHEDNSDWGLVLTIENGNLKLKIKNNNNNVNTIADTKQISDYLFPLCILITHNAEDYHRFKLYTYDNSLRFIGDSIYNIPKVLSNPSTLFGFSQSYSDQPYIVSPVSIFIHEIGYSNTCNIVENPDRFKNQISVNDLFDSYKTWAGNIDDDISMWKLGDFKVCQFSPDFDFFTKRVGKDFLTFKLSHSGSGYSQTTNKQLPEKINLSGVAYHTQIENDFLRFPVSDIPSIDKDNFYAVAPRISKTLPRGYKINNESIVIDSIIEHDTNSDILWPNGKIGPKLLVSLYTKNQDSNLVPDKSFGLINRSTHYLEPSGCIRKLTSRFTFDDLFDQSEPWASFEKETHQREFTERFLSKDVDDMFLQYDLVYPSGKPIDSLIKLHSSNIRLDNSIGFFVNHSGNFNLSTSGGYYTSNNVNFYASGSHRSKSDYVTLNVLADKFYASGSLNMAVSGGLWAKQNLNMYSLTIGSMDSSSSQFFSTDYFGSSPQLGLNLYCSGQFMREENLPLYVSPLIQNYSDSLNLFLSEDKIENGQLFENMTLCTYGTVASYDAYPESAMSMYIDGLNFAQQLDTTFILFTKSYEPSISYVDNSFNLFTLNYPISNSLINVSATIRWDNTNVGEGITSVDNVYAYVDVDDNIRGVDLACYGDCKQ